MMTPDEFKKRMQEIRDAYSGDPEGAHGKADDLLIECLRSLGYDGGCNIFECDITKWYA